MRVVGEPDRLGLVGERDHGGDRAEDLLAGDAVVGLDRREHRRREPEARTLGRAAAEGDRRAVVAGTRRPSRAGRPRSAGPSACDSSSGSPTRSARDVRPRAARGSGSSSHSCTRIRERAQQSCPALPNTASGAAAAAASRSASAKTMLADLPPSSSVTRLIVAAAPAAIERPTSVEPVKAILATSGCSTRRCPHVAPGPTTTLTTPSGSPPRAPARRSAARVSGVSSAGFSTTVLPAASAGRELPRGDRQREVPGRDQPDHAERLAHGERLPAGDRDRVAEQPLGRAGVVAEGVDDHPHLPARVGDRLAGVARLEQRELLAVRPRARRRARSSSRARSPGASARQPASAAVARARPPRRPPRRRRAGTSASTSSVAGSRTDEPLAQRSAAASCWPSGAAAPHRPTGPGRSRAGDFRRRARRSCGSGP